MGCAKNLQRKHPEEVPMHDVAAVCQSCGPDHSGLTHPTSSREGGST